MFSAPVDRVCSPTSGCSWRRFHRYDTRSTCRISCATTGAAQPPSDSCAKQGAVPIALLCALCGSCDGDTWVQLIF